MRRRYQPTRLPATLHFILSWAWRGPHRSSTTWCGPGLASWPSTRHSFSMAYRGPSRSSAGSDDRRWIIASPPRSSSATTGSRCRLPRAPTRLRSIRIRSTGSVCPPISPELLTPTTTISSHTALYQRHCLKMTCSPVLSVTTSEVSPVYKLLFLCTGNYYRSRFAELLFNAMAAHHALPWQAFSRGLALDRGVNNIGPMSPFAIDALCTLGITSVGTERFPVQVEERDLQAA